MEFTGFVDLQVNGYKGVDFSSEDLTADEFNFACNEIIKAGTIAFLPTVITSTPETYERNLKLIAAAMKQELLQKHLPGIHIEGPFISKEDGARGAHNKDWVKRPDINFLNLLYQWSEGKIKLITIAAELNGAEELCLHARKLGIMVSLGHQLATEEDMKKLIKAGAETLTHLGNGLPMQVHRHENPLWAGLGTDDLKAMIITDGHHLPPSLIKTIIRAKGFSNVIVVSDASPVAGLAPGNYHTLGNEAILDHSGRLFNPETGYLVGSSSIMLDCMNYLLSLKILSPEQLLEVSFYNPLKLIGVDHAEFESKFKPKVKLKERFILL